MSTPTNPRRERPSTYFVQDRSNEEELRRVIIQDQMLTRGMGGVLREQCNQESLRRILDVSCGTGGWLIEAAKTYPTIASLVGVDVSDSMVEFARAQAKIQQVSDRVEFFTMDALLMLEFPQDFFDLVNLRAGGSYLRTWDWPKLLDEFQRVCRPGGVVRVTEGNIIQSTSPALTQLSELLQNAFYQAGHYFTPEENGLTGELARLLRQHGFQNVQTCPYKLSYRAGTPEGQHFYEDMKRAYRTLLPFLRKWTRVPANYEVIYQEALEEMQQADFVATWNLLTAWGNVA